MPSAATFASGLSSNYTITYVNGTLTVNPAALTITANNASKTYGQTATLPGTAFTTSGLVNGDTVGSVTETSTGCGGDGRRSGPYAIVPSAATFSVGPEQQLHDHLRQRHADGQPGRADHHGQQREQDLRPDGDLRRHGVHDQRPGQRRHGQQRDRDQHGRGGDGGGRGRHPITPSAATSRRAWQQLHDHLRRRHADGQPGGADDHGQQREQDLRPDGDLRRHRVHDQRPGQRRHGQQRDRDQHGRGGDGGGRDRPDRAQRRDVSAGLSSNYTITYVNGTLTVNPAALTITANSASKTYGQTATFAGTAFTTSGLVNGDTVSGVTETSTGSAATAAVRAPYAIMPSAARSRPAWAITRSPTSRRADGQPGRVDDHGE